MKKTHRVTFIREEKSIHFRTSQDQYNDVQNDFDKSAYTKSSRKRTKLNMLRCFEWADEIHKWNICADDQQKKKIHRL